MVRGSIDTNILLRFVLQDVPQQHQAVVQLLKRADSPLLLSDVAIVETAFVLERYYGLDRKSVIEALEVAMEQIELDCNQALIENALFMYGSHPSLSIADCYLASKAMLDGREPLWTFDKKLANQAIAAKLLV